MKDFTTIRFTLPSEGNVKIEIYNLSGKKITELLNEKVPAKNFSITWNGKNDRGIRVPGGVYICRINASGSTGVCKILTSQY